MSLAVVVVSSRGNGLAELDNDTLSCYGPGSVDSLDRNWGVQAAGAVTTIVFNFIEFGDVVNKAFSKIRTKFPAAHVSITGLCFEYLHPILF